MPPDSFPPPSLTQVQNPSPSPSPSPSPQPVRHGVILRVLAGIFGALIVLVSLPFLLVVFFPDSPLPDYSDIAMRVVNVPESQNGYYDLIKAEPVRDQGGIIDYPFTVDFEAFADPNLVPKILEENATALQHLADAAAKPFFQEPYTSRPELYRPDTKLPLMGVWRETNRASILKAFSLQYEKKDLEAFGEASRGIILTQRIKESQPTLMAYLVGISVGDNSLEAMGRLAASTTLSGAELAPYIVLLDGLQDPKGIKNAWKVEAHLHRTSLAAMNESMKKGIAPEGLSADNWFERMVWWLLPRTIYYRPNQTLALNEQMWRNRIEAGGDCASSHNDWVTQWMLSFDLFDKPWKIPFTENVVGKVLFKTTAASLSTMDQKNCSLSSRAALTQSLIALRAHMNDHGSLPERLDELVPEYLAAVPTDPFDGLPVKYNKNKKMLYSVGIDRKDGEGDQGESWRSLNWHDTPDQVIRIPF